MGSRFRVILLFGALLATACGDDPAGPGNGKPPPAPITWNHLRGGIGVDEIRSLWGTSPQHILAAHAGGILRYDGSSWVAQNLPPLPAPLNAVWGASTAAVFAVGDGGTFLRWNGSSWNGQTSPTLRNVKDVNGTSAGTVFAVATDGLDAELLRYDGASWSSLHVRAGAAGNAVFAVPEMTFAACGGGVMLRYDDDGIHVDDTGFSEDLLDVWASSANDAHAVGEAGRILHWDGNAWTPSASGTAVRLRAISGTSAADIDACGDGGVMLHFDGAQWSPVSSGTGASLRAAWQLPDGHRVAGGGFGTFLAGFQGQWAPRHLGQPFAYESVWSVSGYYVAVGSGPAGGVARDRDGFGWEFPEALHAVVGFDAAFVVAAGDGGAMYRFDGFMWQKEPEVIASTLRGLTALVSRFGEPFRIYAVGENGALLRWGAGTWSVAAPPAGAEDFDVVDVWAAAIDDVFAVASNSTSVLRYDDPYELAGWTLEETPATDSLLAVGGWRGDVYVASASGEIFFNSGSGWQPMASPVTSALRDIRALSERSIFAVGDAGAILYFDGTGWRRTTSGFFGDFHAIWGAADREVFAVGTQGAVFRHRN